MRIKPVSDLHLEFSDYTIDNNGADVLVLAGDVMIAQTLHSYKVDPAVADYSKLIGRQRDAFRYRSFLKKCSEQFEHVIYVAGNHEFYHGKFFSSIDYLREECDVYPNVHYLENDSVEIDDVVFMGATMWSDFNNYDPLTMMTVSDQLTDYKAIRNDFAGYRRITTNDVVARHNKTRDYFREVIKNTREKYGSDSKIVMVSHHSPSFRSVDPYYADRYYTNGAYHSNMDEFFMNNPEIKLAIHGHIHCQWQYKIGETMVVCNPRGYHTNEWEEGTGFDPAMIIEV